MVACCPDGLGLRGRPCLCDNVCGCDGKLGVNHILGCACVFFLRHPSAPQSHNTSGISRYEVRPGGAKGACRTAAESCAPRWGAYTPHFPWPIVRRTRFCMSLHSYESSSAFWLYGFAMLRIHWRGIVLPNTKVRTCVVAIG